MDTVPRIELLWWEGCPSTEHALELVRSTLDELELGACEVRMVEVRSDEDARRLSFRGSPTIRIDGIDLADLIGGPEAAEAPALTCRLYRRRDGRVSPTPDPADVRDGLRLAVAAR